MNTVLDIFQAICGLLVVLVARLGLVAAVAAALVAPVALALGMRSSWRRLRARMRGLLRIGNVLYRPDVRYAAGHTWIEREGASARIGIDGLAQEILPWALAVRLPKLGESLVEGQIAAVISCGAVEARFAAPLAGRVVAVNTAVAHDPSLVKEDGFGRGWLYVLEPAGAGYDAITVGDAARDWMKAEAKRLRRFYETRLGPLWRLIVRGPAPMLSPDVWADLTREFLRA